MPKPGIFRQPKNASGIDLNGGKIEACDKELAMKHVFHSFQDRHNRQNRLDNSVRVT